MDSTLAFVNGNVVTVDAGDTCAEALVVTGDRISFVGSSADARALVGASTEVVDLDGRALVPGFTENHLHLLEVSQDVSWLDCTPDQVSSIPDIVELVRQAAEETPPGEWILGWGFNESRLVEKRYPTRRDLDHVSPNHPVALRQVESMSWTANTAGLRRMGIEDTTPDPPGGHMLRDEQGHPLGPLFDNCRVVYIFPSLPIPDVDELSRNLEQLAVRLASLGITSVNDAGIFSAEQIDGFQRLAKRRKLVRVYLNLYVGFGSDWDTASQAYKLYASGVSTGFGDDWLRIGPAVIGVDGGTGGRRAALFEPYSNMDDGYSGSFRVDQAFLDEFCLDAHSRGYQIGAVAHGDHGIAATLDAFEKAMVAHPRPNPRHRLEHAYLWNPELLRRAAELGVVVSSQPAILRLFNRENTIDAWGPERAKYGFPYRSFKEHGVIASGGSDCPLISPDPLLGIRALVDRCIWDESGGVQLAPSQSLGFLDALRVYTFNGAYGDRAEDRWGSLEQGKYADLVVLNEDPLRDERFDLQTLRVDETYVAGQRVYAAG